MDRGVFELRSLSDLLEKLKHGDEALVAAENAYLTFNFFVTAEHLVDWVHPKDRSKRK
jgi:hypothetical protein